MTSRRTLRRAEVPLPVQITLEGDGPRTATRAAAR